MSLHSYLRSPYGGFWERKILLQMCIVDSLSISYWNNLTSKHTQEITNCTHRIMKKKKDEVKLGEGIIGKIDGEC